MAIDPLSVVSLTAEGLSICVKVISILKKYASAIKHVKTDILELIKRVERIRNVSGLLRMFSLELWKTKYSSMQIEIDEAEYMKALNQLKALAEDVETKSPIAAGLFWGSKKSTAQALIKRLRELEDDIVHVVSIIGATATDIAALKEDVASYTDVHPAFEDLSLLEGAPQITPKVGASHSRVRTWLGHTLRTNLPEDYLQWRDKLSEAAYYAQWDQMWEAMEAGDAAYNETWANAIRLKSLEESGQMSFWTPLHQVVYGRAPVAIAQKVINAGAFRTLRTRWTRYGFKDLTPLELAHELGYHHLFDILAPVIRTPIPTEILEKLQEHFHGIIEGDLGARIERERLFLPQLHVLTELSNEPLWYPLNLASNEGGYLFQLDDRDLVVKAVNVQAAGEVQMYRISADGVVRVDEALIHGAPT